MRQYPETVKAEILAALATGASLSALSREHGIPKPTIRTWRDKAGLISTVEPQKKQDLGVLIGDYLSAGLQALTAQARLASDPDWIAKQDADKLAILHGVLADKLGRVLAALEPANAD